MPIKFSEHATNQLRRRRISQKLIIEAVRNPRKKIVGFRGRSLRLKQVGDKILEVVTKTEGSRITIITAYFLEE